MCATINVDRARLKSGPSPFERIIYEIIRLRSYRRVVNGDAVGIGQCITQLEERNVRVLLHQFT